LFFLSNLPEPTFRPIMTVEWETVFILWSLTGSSAHQVMNRLRFLFMRTLSLLTFQLRKSSGMKHKDFWLWRVKNQKLCLKYGNGKKQINKTDSLNALGKPINWEYKSFFLQWKTHLFSYMFPGIKTDSSFIPYGKIFPYGIIILSYYSHFKNT